MQKLQQDTQNIEECYVASQVYIHDECYNLDTNISLQALQMVKNNQSFLEIRDENLVKLNESITKKKLELYIKKQQQQQQQQQQQYQNTNFSLNRIEQFLQSILGRTQGFMDRRNQQEEEEEEEEEEFVDMTDEEYQNEDNTSDHDESS